jgi:hypothetical protein
MWFDQEARLWVGSYASDYWHPEEYHVFNPGGGEPERVRIPDRMQILDAGGGMFLAVERNDLGAEAVSLYAFPQ